MHPISYVKTHPTATIVTFLAGMVLGPWALGFVQSKTGVGVNLPVVGG